MNIDTIGIQISTLRKQRNMTQKQLANALQVSHQVISKWESGLGIPKTEMMIEIAKVFDITIDSLLSTNIPVTKKQRTLSFSFT